MKKWAQRVTAGIVAVGLLGGGMTVYAGTGQGASGASSSTSSTSANGSLAGPDGGKLGVGALVGPRPRAMMRFFLREAATVIGVTPTELRSDFKAGQSLADVASSKGMSEAALISNLESGIQAKLNQAVQGGQLTASQATKLEGFFNAHAQNVVTVRGGFRHGMKAGGVLGAGAGWKNGSGLGAGTGWKAGAGWKAGGAGPKAGMLAGPLARRKAMKFAVKDTAKLVGVKPLVVVQDLKAGQSLAAVASGHGVTETTLISTLEGDVKAKLDTAVAAGKLTSAQETKLVGAFDAHAQKLVEFTLGAKVAGSASGSGN